MYKNIARYEDAIDTVGPETPVAVVFFYGQTHMPFRNVGFLELILPKRQLFRVTTNIFPPTIFMARYFLE